jgi:hypothetical protein
MSSLRSRKAFGLFFLLTKKYKKRFINNEEFDAIENVLQELSL